MTRRREDSLADLLLTLPWWMSIVASVIGFLALRFAVPAIAGGSPVESGMALVIVPFAHYVALGLLLVAPFAYFNQRRRQRRLATQTGLESIAAMSWQDFELLVAEAFRRRGFAVEEQGGAASDGGIDLVLRRDGATTLVQCKHWRVRQVGVKPIRELYGMMTAEKASGALFVTSGSFTADATAFVENKPIGLIEGNALLELVQSVQAQVPAAPQAIPSLLSCHVCSRPMVRRLARRGFRSGEAFWGCTGYPHCKGTRPIQAV